MEEFARTMKKIKHISLKSLKQRAWKLQSEYVRKIENYICFTCGKQLTKQTSDCSHYIHKACLDFDLINLHCCCTRCNRFLHGNLGVYAECLIAEYGEEAIAELRQRANQVKKFTIIELQDLIAKYTKLLVKGER